MRKDKKNPNKDQKKIRKVTCYASYCICSHTCPLFVCSPVPFLLCRKQENEIEVDYEWLSWTDHSEPQRKLKRR